MSDTRDLLVEIGTEELPPASLFRLSQAFHDSLVQSLLEADFAHGATRIYATPRRIGLLVENLASQQPNREQIRKGPTLAAAYGEDGKPTKAAEGFARSCGVTVDQLERSEGKKGNWLVHRQAITGKSIGDLLQEMLKKALDSLPIAKRMRWGDSSHSFVRPVHWIVTLYGNQVLPLQLFGLSSGNLSRGHRFMSQGPIEIDEASHYEQLLEEQGKVLVDPQRRRDMIKRAVQRIASHRGLKAPMPYDLLDEVTALTEWPLALECRFETAFLAVPKEALIYTMEGNQKYFALLDGEGQLQPYFVVITNLDSPAPSAIISGNERVIRPRFSDAKFFWEQDKKQALEQHGKALESVVYHRKLGSIADRVGRLRALAARIAGDLKADAQMADRAATLCKCDLMTDMVKEFATLQGIMGRYYALEQGESAVVAAAIEQHYWPRFAGDQLPDSEVGCSLALAEKIDTLAGIFSAGEVPTGDKDPFGCRRAALGIIRILVEKGLDASHRSWVLASMEGFAGLADADAKTTEISDYIATRMRGYFADQGYDNDVVEAVLTQHADRPFDAAQRMQAVSAFKNMPQAASLAAANKRTKNILAKSSTLAVAAVDPSLLTQSEEKDLFQALQQMQQDTQQMILHRDYQGALLEMTSLHQAVDGFFDEVLVNAEDERVRVNRLALLRSLFTLFSTIADIGLLRIPQE